MATGADAGMANGDKKLSEAEKRKQRKQRNKAHKQQRWQEQEERAKKATGAAPAKKDGEDDDIIIEYVSAPLPELVAEEPEQDEPMGGLGLGSAGLGAAPKADGLEDLRKVFERFAKAEEVLGTAPKDEDEEEGGRKDDKAIEKAQASSSDSDSDDEDGKKKKMSRKQSKLISRMKIAELKQQCERPEVVEVWDVTSTDPVTLVFLKAYRNTVSVPRHWSQKRKYLQGKRGIEKPPFKLPDFIEATGITEMRNAYQEKEETKKLKAKQRDRMAPKMGRMDIDYQVLHDAFFKHQTKPKMTDKGELYYEGKEFEAHVDNVRPGVLGEELRKALGMTDNSPPPWLINMQRYGPPPSYPNLRAPGLNAPIPPGAQFGYHSGGWGKPPVDEDGNPLYGDVFATKAGGDDSDDEVEKSHRWGELEAEAEESSEEEEDEDEEEGDGLNEQEMAEGIASGMASGMVSGLTSGITSSLPSGIETPDMMVNLRKAAESEQPRQLYQVLEEKKTSLTGALLGTDHVYVIPGTQTTGGTQTGADAGGKKGGSKKLPGVLANLPQDVEVALTPEEIEGLDEAAIKQLYESKLAEARASNKREDFSDLVAAKAAQQKRKAAQRAEDKGEKKFRF